MRIRASTGVQYGANPDTPWLEIGSTGDSGYLRVGATTIDTTGVLGVWNDSAGNTHYTAFPGWATIPTNYNLALSRHWHLTFAWLFVAGVAALSALEHRQRPSLARSASPAR